MSLWEKRMWKFHVKKNILCSLYNFWKRVNEVLKKMREIGSETIHTYFQLILYKKDEWNDSHFIIKRFTP